MAQGAGLREYLENFAGFGHALAGNLDEARAAVERSPVEQQPVTASLVEIFGGDIQRGIAIAESSAGRAEASGDAWTAAAYRHHMGRARWALGDPAGLDEYRHAAKVAAGGGSGVFELTATSGLASRLLEVGRVDEARPAVERCEAVLAAGDGWRSRAGDVKVARAALDAADGRDDAAEEGFAAAIDVLREFGSVWSEAEAWLQWGVALKRRDPAAASEKLDAAADLYTRHGAGATWHERVARNR
jgi:hypothetical protein